MGKRARAREATEAPDAASPREIMRSGYARGEARNEEIRRNLEPVAPGERPGAVTIGAIVALVLAIANTLAVVLDRNVTGDDGKGAALALSFVLLVCAIFMWRNVYWAVLGFQALLVIQIILAASALLVAPSIWAAVVWFVVLMISGWLFWKLIRALARLQMPER